MNWIIKFIGSLPIVLYLALLSNLNFHGTFGLEEFEHSAEDQLRLIHHLKDKIKNKSSWTDSKPKHNFSSLHDHFASKNNKSEPTKDKDDDHGLNGYNWMASFVNQTRSTIGLVAHHGNFTLIQAALLFTIGCMAAGAATVALEGLAFRQRETEIELYNQQLHHHDHGGAYGPPPPPPLYGTPDLHNSHSNPVATYADPGEQYFGSSGSGNQQGSSYGYGQGLPGESNFLRSTRQKRDLHEEAGDNFQNKRKARRRTSFHHRSGVHGHHSHGHVHQIGSNRNGFRTDGGFSPLILASNSYQNSIPNPNPNSNSHNKRHHYNFRQQPLTPRPPLSAAASYATGVGFPAPNDYLMLNRFGIKHHQNQGSKRRVIHPDPDDDNTEYFRAELPFSPSPMKMEDVPFKVQPKPMNRKMLSKIMRKLRKKGRKGDDAELDEWSGWKAQRTYSKNDK